MSLYSYRLESAVQDPSNPGNDLDQIEKAALESHDDEVERAEEAGLGEDPMEESAFILYEAEYNYNQIMRAIGIAEINEAAVGKQYSFTEEDKAGFFESIKKWFTRLFETISNVFGKAIKAMDLRFKHQKKFVETHKKEITDGFNKDWSKAGFANLINSDFVATVTDKFKNYGTIITFVDEYTEREITEDDRKARTEAMYKSVSKDFFGSEEYTTAEAIRDAAIKTAKGDRSDNLKGQITSSYSVISILSNDKEVVALKSMWKNVKNATSEVIKNIEEVRKTRAADNKNAMQWVHFLCDLERKKKSVLASLCSVACNVAKARRSLAMSLAVTWAKAGGAKISTEENQDATTQHENARLNTESINSLFNNINIF